MTLTAVREDAPPAQERPDQAERRWRQGLVAIALVGLAVRVAFVAYTRHLIPWGDAYYYHYQANLVATGHGFIEPYTWNFYHQAVATAYHPPAWILYLSAFSLVGLKSWTAHRLAGCLLGAVSVAVIGLLGREIAGPAHGRRVGLIAAGLAALYPYLFMNDGVSMSESMVILVCTAAALLAYRVLRQPTLGKAAGLGLACGLATMTRSEQILLFAILALPAIALARSVDLRRRVRLAAVCLAVGAVPIVPWVARNAVTFHHPVLLSTNLDPTLQVSNCPSTFDRHGPFYGFWDFQCLKGNPSGDESDQGIYWRHQAVHFIRTHKRQVPGVVAARFGRFWNLYRPNQTTVLDRSLDGRPRWLSLSGLGIFYILVLASVAGARAVHRRGTALFPLVAAPVTVTLATVLTFANTRYRAPAEVSLIVLAAVACSAFFERGGRVLDLGKPPPPPTGQRVFPLFDGYRALAAMAVLAVHVGFVSGFTLRHRGVGSYVARLDSGVALFFLISGFLLYRPFVIAHFTGRPAPAVWPYLKRRALRILPAYWVALTIVVYVLHLATIHGRRAFVAYYGLLQIYSPKYLEGGISQAWSLCTEISFYLFLPLYAWGLRGVARRLRRSALAVELAGLAVLFGGAMVWRWWVVAFSHHATVVVASLDWLPANADLFAMGMLLAVLSARSELGVLPVRLATAAGRRPWVWWSAAAVAFWLVSTQSGLHRDFGAISTGAWLGRQELYGLTAFFLLVPGVFGAADAGLGRRFFALRPVQFLGLISYGIYLWHEAAIDEFRRWTDTAIFGGRAGSMLLVVVVISIGVSVASYVVVERPALRLKDRRFPTRRPRVAGEVVPP